MLQQLRTFRAWKTLSGALFVTVSLNFTGCTATAGTQSLLSNAGEPLAATGTRAALSDTRPRAAVTANTKQSLAEPPTATAEHEQATEILFQLMQRYHYSPVAVDDELSEQIFDRYLETLDPQKNFLLASDVEEFSSLRQGFDDVIRDAKLDPVFAIFDRFRTRVVERTAFAKNLLNNDFDFTRDESYTFDREDSPWLVSQSAEDELWRKRVKNDVLTLRLAEQSTEEIIETLDERYERMERRVVQLTPNDVFQIFINAYTLSVEPHTSYFSPRSSENFEINMSLSLEGIGASLSTEGEFTVVRDVIAGGPAALSEQLASDDRIVGVGDGEDAEIVDVVSWPLNDVVDLIRGPKGSTIRLEILPASAPEGTPPTLITLVRDKIKLEEQAAKKSVVEISKAGKTQRYGVIDLPTFYLDSAARASGQSDYRSTTRDVHRLLDELTSTDGGVDGIIMDLRGNGGGSLDEAIQLTGLFIKSGPVVQIRDADGGVDAQNDRDNSIAYDGPLAVLIDRNSASASEIFAAAIQDYHRGVIVGEPTFGKGTVQTIAPLDRAGKLGQLKITIAQFFRINGDGTQFRGVVPDVLFPTALDSDAQGESGLDNALPWDAVPPAKYDEWPNANEDYSALQARHEKRFRADEEFTLLIDELESQREARASTTVSLLEAERRAEMQEQGDEEDDRIELFRIAFGVSSSDDEDDEDAVPDILLDEAAHVLSDVIELAPVTKP